MSPVKCPKKLHTRTMKTLIISALSLSWRLNVVPIVTCILSGVMIMAGGVQYVVTLLSIPSGRNTGR